MVHNNRAITGHANGTVSVYDLNSKQRLYRFKRDDARFGLPPSPARKIALQRPVTTGPWPCGEVVREPTGNAARRSREVRTSARRRPLRPLARLRQRRSHHSAVGFYRANAAHIPQQFRFSFSVTFSPDDTTLAASSLDGTIKLLSVDSYRVQRTLSGHTPRITALAFSNYMIFWRQRTEDVWFASRSLKRPSSSGRLTASVPALRVLTFTNDRHTFVTGGQDGVIRLSLPDPRIAQGN